jgi:hypothetical protein
VAGLPQPIVPNTFQAVLINKLPWLVCDHQVTRTTSSYACMCLDVTTVESDIMLCSPHAGSPLYSCSNRDVSPSGELALRHCQDCVYPQRHRSCRESCASSLKGVCISVVERTFAQTSSTTTVKVKINEGMHVRVATYIASSTVLNSKKSPQQRNSKQVAN